MLRSMLSAASAVRNHQVYMDVVANNIANVNTTAYKSGRITFRELMTQVLSPGSGPQATRGGINPVQIGLGMTMGAVDSNFTGGALQSTGRTNDLAIQGSGFFVFRGPGQNLYSRDGSLDLGLDGSLVNTATGLQAMGWNANANGVIDTTAPLQALNIPLNGAMIAKATQKTTAAGNLNAEAAIFDPTTSPSVSEPQTVAGTVDGFATSAITAGQTRLPTGDYYVEVRQNTTTSAWEYRLTDSSGNAVPTAASATGAWSAIGAGGTVATGRGISVTLGAGPYTAGVKGAGAARVHYDNGCVNTTTQIYDSLGALHTVNMTFVKTAPNSWTWEVSGSDPTMTLGTPNTGTLNFSSSGRLPTNASAALNLSFTNGAANQAVNINLANLTQLAEDSSVSASEQDGSAAGSLQSFSISGNGEIVGSYTNGLYRTVGQMAMANFVNTGGLLRQGDNMFAPSANSGAAQIGEAGSGGRGQIQAGYVEMSNVDLAQQFTSMIMAERGFQANSRVITASDQMLQDLVNLVR